MQDRDGPVCLQLGFLDKVRNGGEDIRRNLSTVPRASACEVRLPHSSARLVPGACGSSCFVLLSRRQGTATPSPWTLLRSQASA